MQKQDVLFLCQFFYPEYNSSATLPWDTAKYLAKSGLSVGAVCGYPKEYKTGYEITGINEADEIENIKVFHAGTKTENGKILTSGGRVLCITAVGKDLPSSIQKAYEGVSKISFKDMAFRKDIGKKGLKNLGE